MACRACCPIDGVSAFRDWGAERLDELSGEAFAINQLIYTEVCFAYASGRELDGLIDRLGIERVNLPWEAAITSGAVLLVATNVPWFV